jgi:hypothetical protein
VIVSVRVCGLTRLVALAWLAVLVTGCGLSVRQKAAIQRFASSTSDFATVTSTELVATRRDLIDMNTLRAELGDEAVRPDRVDALFTVDRVRARVDAVAALKAYGELLNVLATSSQTAELKNAADGFVVSLRKVPGVGLSDEKAGAISTVVQAVGGLVVEYKRAEAVRDVVLATNQQVMAVVELVRRDFDPKADHWSLGYAVTIEGLRGAAALAARGPDAAGRAALIGRARVTAEQNQRRFETISGEVAASVLALREAQVNLRHVVQSRDITVDEIQSYAARVEDFVKIYRILRAP